MASSPGGLHVQASTAFWSHKSLSDWDISLTLQARFWSLHIRAFLAKWHAGQSEVCGLCGLTSDTVPHRLGGCTHPAITSRVKLRHGCTVDLIAHMVGVGRHGDCFMLYDAEGHDGRYRRFPDWLLGMGRLPSRPDLVLLEGTEQGPGGQIHSINKDAWLHLVEVTFTTDFALVDRVASKTAQHARLCRCLAEAGWSNVGLHLFIVGHTGVMGLDNAQALLDLGVPPSQVQPALEAIAAMGCTYSCEMLMAYWRGPANASVPSPDAPNPAAVHMQALLSGVAKRPPPCLLHMAARRPPSRIPGAAARRPALQISPQHGAGRKRQRSPDYATPPKRACVHASSHPALSTAASPPAIDLSHSQNLRRSARLAAKCVPAPQSCSPQCHPVLLPRRKRPLVRPIYPPLRRLRLDAGDALHVLARASAFSRLACPALHFVAVSSSGCISLTDVRLVHDPEGGGC